MKILLLDIETAPHMAAVWGLWQQNVSITQLIKPGYTLCWAAKWYGNKEVEFDSIKQSSPKRMVRRIHRLLNEADAVVHYNGTKFDIPTLNKEFLLQGLNPPAPYKQIDLLKTARSRMRLASNKLDFLAQALGLGQKTKHKGFELWLECMARNPDAWETMRKYNINDVVLLEKVYERLLPWIKGHPNISLHTGDMVCPHCGSAKYQNRGSAITAAGKYARMQCSGCGTWFRGNLNEAARTPKFREVA